MVKPSKKNQNFSRIVITIFLLSLYLVACSDMHAPYQEYIQDEEIIYRAKADSVVVLPGKNRIQLKWWYSDYKVTRSVVSWNSENGSDSVEVERPGTQGIDTVTVILNDMKEQSYNFEIINYDNEGNSSLAMSTLGNVYGSEYESALLNRPIIFATGTGSTAFIEWGSSTSSAIGVQVTYTDINDTKQIVSVSPNEASTELADVKPGSVIQYQTLYLPEPMAIDTFYAGAETYNIKYE